MSKDIYDSDVDIRLSESVDIYMPHTYKVKGEIDGKAYEILINERDLPEGVPPDPAVITKVIPWDEKFYMEWEIQGNPPISVTVKDGSSEVIRLEDYEGKSVTFDQTGLVNGTQYDLQVFANIVNIETESLVSNVTLFDVTLSGLSVSPGSTTVDVTWDGIADVSAWEVTLVNTGTGKQVDKVTKLQGVTSATLSGVEPYNNYEVQLQAFSEGKVFSSSKSTTTFSTQRVLYVTEGNELNVYNAQDGSFIVTAASGDDYGAYGIDHDPIRDKIVTANSNRRIHCWSINPDWSLTEDWNYPSPSNWDFIGMPMFDYEGDVYVVDYDSGRKLTKLDGSDGSELWSVFINTIGDSSARPDMGIGIHPLGVVVGDSIDGQVHIHSSEDGSLIKTIEVPAADGNPVWTDYTRVPQCDELGHVFTWNSGNPSGSSERCVVRFLDSKSPTPGPTLDFQRNTGYNTMWGWVTENVFTRMSRFGNLNIYDRAQSFKFQVPYYDSMNDYSVPYIYGWYRHSFDVDGYLYHEDFDLSGRPLVKRDTDGNLVWQNDIGSIRAIQTVPSAKPYPWIATAADLSIEQVDTDQLDITVWAWSSNPTIEYALYDQAGTTEVVAWQKSRHLTAPSDGDYTIKVRDRVQTTPITQAFTVAPVISNGLQSWSGEGNGNFGSGSFGWEFTPNSALNLEGFRARLVNTSFITLPYTIHLRLYRKSDSSLLGSKDITFNSTQVWIENYLASSVLLNSGVTYVVAAIVDNSSFLYCYYANSATYLNSITVDQARSQLYNSGSGSMPTSEFSNDRPWTFFDVLLS